MRAVDVQEPPRVLRRRPSAAARGPAVLFEIAGVRFVSRRPLPPLAFSPAYRSFTAARHRGPGRVTIPLHIRAAQRLPAPRTPLFRTESWTISRDEDYLLALGSPAARSQAALIARFPPALDRLEVTVADGRPNPIAYPVDQILMMHLLAGRAGCILHAAGLGLGRRGFAFCGCSGAGKSTLARQLHGRGRWSPLSDDRVIVRAIGGGYRLFGTPWPGTGEIAENRSFSCRGLVFLRHAREHRLQRLPGPAALRRLLPVASVPWYDPGPMALVLDFLAALVAQVPAWELSFRPERSVAAFLERELGLRAGAAERRRSAAGTLGAPPR